MITNTVNSDYRSRPELAAYYADRKLMWRNVILIGISNLGWGMAGTLTVPLITLKLLELGVRENVQATIGSFNGWILSFLVMWFSWMSDHTCSRLGRRKPYLFMAAPFIIIPMVIFPFFSESKWVWFLIALQIIKMIAMDMKASTFPLLSIDCVPRDLLARMNSIFTIAGGVMGFLTMRYAGDLISVAEWFPFVLGGTVMAITTLAALLIKEPPIHHPATERFKPWSTFKVAARDKRIFWLMLGVAMISGFVNMNNTWVWFWAKETLNLQRQDIFSALSWASLVNIVLAYPIGWLIDRWGGFRVVLIYWVGQVICFAWAMNVHDKAGLIILSLATTVIAPLYTAADIMIYKSADPKDVGSMTSSNSCIRNMYGATLGFVAGWLIFFFGHNFRIGFVIGIIMSTVGLMMFIIHHYQMRNGTTSQECLNPELKPVPETECSTTIQRI
jgi:MFS family permease